MAAMRAPARGSVQDIAALRLPRDLRDLRLAQRSRACSPRLSGVAAGTWATCSLCPLGGVERPRRVVRFARLIQRPGRVLGGPAVGAAFGGNLSLFWLPPSVINARTSGLLILFAWRSATSPETLAEGYPGTQRSSWPGTSSRRVDGEVALWQPTARAVGVTHECSCSAGSYRTSRRPGSRRFHQESANELVQLQGQSVDPSHPVPHRDH
jgi:hypothetical protein